MNNGRLWLVAGALLALGVIAIGWFVGASPLLAQASSNESQRLGVESQNAAMMLEIAEMKEQFANLDELTERLDELQVSVPGFANTGDFFDEVAAAAGAAGVALQAVVVDGAQPYGAMGSTVASEAEPADGETTDAASTTTEPIATQGTLPGPTVPGAVLAQDLYVLGIELQVDADENQLAAFLAALQGDGRLTLVTQVQSSFGVTQRSTITAYIFIVHDPRFGPVGALPTPSSTPAPDEDDEETEPTPGPTGTPTPGPSATPEVTPTP